MIAAGVTAEFDARFGGDDREQFISEHLRRLVVDGTPH